MKTIKLLALNRTDVQFFSIIGSRQNWKNHSKFVYIDTPRPDNGLTLILCREARFTLENGKILIAERNSIVFIPEGCRYSVEFFLDETDVPPASLLLNFSLCDLSGTRLTVGEEPEILYTDSNGYYKQKFDVAVTDYKAQKMLSCKSRLLNLLHHLILNLQTQSDADDSIQPILDYIDSNLEKNLAIADISKHFAISESSLRRKFRNHLKISPIEYINQSKVEKVKELLNTSEITLEDICEQLGLYDTSHLYKLFRRYTGTTPLQWKKRNDCKIPTAEPDASATPNQTS